MSNPPDIDPGAQDAPASLPPRIFLVAIDDTPELKVALHYACRRAARSDGRVAMVHVSEPTGFREWVGVSELMREEARQQAEATMQRVAAQVKKLSGKMPILYFREGDRREEVMQLIEEEPTISILVLAAADNAKGPGPLVTALTGKYLGRLRIPFTIVPGHLTFEEVDRIA